MEVALPLIALGGLYIVSNQNKSETKKEIQKITQETFTNMGKNINYLPNTKKEIINYPTIQTEELNDNVQMYVNPNTATDKYFDQNYYKNTENNGIKVGNTPYKFFSLSGEHLENSNFKHNNMIPFNGGKIKGYTYDNEISETILDNMIGSGSQNIKKMEQAPLFKPEENINWNYGVPNQSDFFQSRMNTGTKINNVKPFESERVAPGLNQGYTTNGSNGFNSGMEAREKWLPKTVDQLRVETNPKLEYELNGHQGPSYSHIKNSGILGRVEKQTPDTFFINSEDRWLKTTGSEKASTLRPLQEMGTLKRPNNDDNYTGTAKGNKHVGYTPSTFEKSRRVELKTCDVTPSCATNKGPSTDTDNNLKSYTNYSNHRNTTRQPDSIRSGFSGAIGAVISPVLDILRPSRKEEVISNIRVYGEGPKHMVSSSYVINPNETTCSTIKETTMYSPNFYINNQKESQYVNNYKSPDFTQRDTTSYESIGNVGNNTNGLRNYNSVYNQTNNEIKSQTINNRINHGSTQMFNNNMNINISRHDNETNYTNFVPDTIVKLPPSKEQMGAYITPNQNNIEINALRNTPDMLNAFKANPYTHSLTNIA